MNLHQAIVRNGAMLALELVNTLPVGDDCAMIEPKIVGICGTDRDIIGGARNDSARILGHEGIGTVIETGKDSQLLVGDQVVFNPVNPENQDDILGHSRDGLLQRKVVVNNGMLGRGEIVLLESNLPTCGGVLVEPLATVLYGQRLINEVVQPLRMVIIGLGTIGLLHAFVSKLKDNIEVTGVSNSISRLDWVANSGLIELDKSVLGDVDSGHTARRIGTGYDAAVVCTPRAATEWALTCAMAVVRDGGCIDLVSSLPKTTRYPWLVPVENLNGVRRLNVCGRPVPGRRLSVNDAQGKRVVVVGHRGTSLGDINKSIHLLMLKGHVLRSLVTHMVPFAEAAQFLCSRRLLGRRSFHQGDEIIKVGICMSGF